MWRVSTGNILVQIAHQPRMRTVHCTTKGSFLFTLQQQRQTNSDGSGVSLCKINVDNRNGYHGNKWRCSHGSGKIAIE